MKKIYTLLLLLSTMSLMGCSITDSTEELTHPPKLEGDKEEIKLALKDYLPQNTRLIVPPSEDKGSAIKLVDLDGNGVKEAVVFYSVELDENPIRVLILKKESGRWINRAEIKLVGQDLDKVLFRDLDGDGGSELIIGSKVKYSTQKDLNIYSMVDREVEILFKKKYDEMLIEDLNNDKLTEVLILSTDKETEKSFAELYKYFDDDMNKIDQVYFNDGATVNYVEYDYIYKNKKGIIISTTVKEDYINTYMFKMEGDKFNNLIKNGLVQTKKQSNANILSPRDINRDGTIEFALPNSVQENNEDKLINWATEWYGFNGINNVELIKLNYYDEKLGFTFELPIGWKDKVTITNLTRHENTIKEEEYVRLEYKASPELDAIELFTVYIYNKDKLKRLDENKVSEKAIKILEDKDNVFYLDKNSALSEEKLKSIGSEVDKIEKSFKFIRE